MDAANWTIFTMIGLLWSFNITMSLRYPDCREPLWLEVINLVCPAGYALVCFTDGLLPLGYENAACAGWQAWWLWKRRPPRKRRESKVLGRIRDLGHRLVVTH